MKIGDFSKKTGLSVKMIRHYDNIGLLKPREVDKFTNYRYYGEEEIKKAYWIGILKDLDFSLLEIKEILDGNLLEKDLVKSINHKKYLLDLSIDEDIHKRLQMERLIRIVEKEGFSMDKKVDLFNIKDEDINTLLSNIPDTGEFYEKIKKIMEEEFVIMSMDINFFDKINKTYGYDVGDKVIVVLYNLINQGLIDTVGVENYSLTREYGDEYIGVSKGDIEKSKDIVNKIEKLIKEYDFTKIGSPEPVEISFSIRKGNKEENIREQIDNTRMNMVKAKKQGGFGLFISE